jgi:hypothetical protein
MERNPASRQLNGSPAAARPDFTWATPDDDAEIRGLLGRVPMDGAVRMGFTREPSYFAYPDPAGTDERTLLARLNGRLVCLGSLSEREVWFDGKITRVGYLAGLRMEADVRGAPRILREGYRRFAGHARESAAEIWFTSIASDNPRARRVLESHRLGLPWYSRIGELETRVYPVRARTVPPDEAVTPDDAVELDAFLNEEAGRGQLALTWDTHRWNALARDGFGLDQVRVIRRSGRIVAAAGLWDQSKWKQVMIHGYAPWMKQVRNCYNLWSSLRGRPALPAAGCRLPLAHVFPFAIAPGEESALPGLWAAVEALAREARVEWITLGADAADPLWHQSPLRKGGHVYRTTIYQVSSREEPLDRWQSRPLRPEIALL